MYQAKNGGPNDMFTQILRKLRKFWKWMTGNPFQGMELYCIKDEDLQFDPDIDRIMREHELDEIFRSFGNLEEYNKEFVVFLKAHRREFLLDYSQRDGHFRV
jgi:hypothetical protein